MTGALTSMLQLTFGILAGLQVILHDDVMMDVWATVGSRYMVIVMTRAKVAVLLVI